MKLTFVSTPNITCWITKNTENVTPETAFKGRTFRGKRRNLSRLRDQLQNLMMEKLYSFRLQKHNFGTSSYTF